MVFTFVFIWYGIFFHHLVKKLAEIICHYKNFSNFALGNHSGFFSLTLFFGLYKVTKNSAIPQIIKQLNIPYFSSNSR
jgi:hypothetical protein